MSDPFPHRSIAEPLAPASCGHDRAECRLCAVTCDRLVYPSACVARRCPSLYSYRSHDGRRWAGCLHRVFSAEIDLDLLSAAGRSFGALKCAAEPLPVCRTGIERAYPHREDELGCINPEFAEPGWGATFRIVEHCAS